MAIYINGAWYARAGTAIYTEPRLVRLDIYRAWYARAGTISSNSVTYVSMPTKYHIIKHKAFYTNLTKIFPHIMKISVRNSYQTLMTTH